MTDRIIRDTNNLAAAGALADGDAVYLVSSAIPLKLNLSWAALTAGEGLNRFVIGPRWQASVGTPEDPLQGEINEGTDPYFELNSSARVWYKILGPSDIATHKANIVRVNGSGSLNLIAQEDSEIASLEVSNGEVMVPGIIDLQQVLMSGGMVNVLRTGTAPSVLAARIVAGTLNCEKGITSLRISDSGVVFLDSKELATGSVFLHGGTFTVKSSGNMTNLTWDAGIFDTSQLSQPLHFTGDISIFGTADADAVHAFLNNPLITWDNKPEIHIKGFAKA